MAVFAKGADPEQLERLAAELQHDANSVRSSCMVAGTAVRSLGDSWAGGDVGALVASWPRSEVALANAARTLATMSETVRRQAAQQRGASAGRLPGAGAGLGFASGSGSGALPAPSAAEGSGSGAPPQGPPSPQKDEGAVGGLAGPAPVHDEQDTGPGAEAAEGNGATWAQSMTGQAPHAKDADLALLAGDSYPGVRARIAGGPAVVGQYDSYSQIYPDQLKTMGLDPALFQTSVGMSASLYRDESGRYVLAFAGTDSGGDAFEDVTEGLGLAPGLPDAQYMQACVLAQRVQAALGPDAGNLVFTGHSLGGGLAAVASIATGAPAVTFNAAGPGHSSITFAHDVSTDPATRSRPTLMTVLGLAVQGQVRAYHVAGDALTSSQEATPLPDALGFPIRLDPPVSISGGLETTVANGISQHGMDSVIAAITRGYAVGTPGR